jgi:hypothetical protein
MEKTPVGVRRGFFVFAELGVDGRCRQNTKRHFKIFFSQNIPPGIYSNPQTSRGSMGEGPRGGGPKQQTNNLGWVGFVWLKTNKNNSNKKIIVINLNKTQHKYNTINY